MQLLEHIHITVKSIEGTEAFLLTAVPEMRRRTGMVIPNKSSFALAWCGQNSAPAPEQ